MGKENSCVLIHWRVMSVSEQTASLRTVIKPLYYICKIFGLATFSLNKSYQSKRNTFLSSGAWWSCILAMIYGVNLSLEMKTSMKDTEDTAKIIILNVLYYVSLYFTSIASLCSSNIIKRSQILEILDKSEELINMLMKLDKDGVYKRLKRDVLLEATILLLVSVVINIPYIYYVYDPSNFNSFMPILESLGSISNSLMIIQFVNLVVLLRRMCSYINHDLELYCKTLEDFSRYSITRRYPGGVSMCRSPYVKLTSLFRHKVHNLRIAYTKLSVVTYLVNSFFGLPILLSVLWLFMNIVTVLYMTLFFFINYSDPDRTVGRYVTFSISVIYCIYCGILMTMIAMSCHLVGDETTKSMFHIQKLLLNRDIDKETEGELVKFCSQLNCLKLEFSAYGFFKLNLPFLNTFISLTFTYILITIQLN